MDMSFSNNKLAVQQEPNTTNVNKNIAQDSSKTDTNNYFTGTTLNSASKTDTANTNTDNAQNNVSKQDTANNPVQAFWAWILSLLNAAPQQAQNNVSKNG